VELELDVLVDVVFCIQLDSQIDEIIKQVEKILNAFADWL